jgi:hypothetical protein
MSDTIQSICSQEVANNKYSYQKEEKSIKGNEIIREQRH